MLLWINNDIEECQKNKAYTIDYSNSLNTLDNSTIEAVKNKIIYDEEYRKELLKRVLP